MRRGTFVLLFGCWLAVLVPVRAAVGDADLAVVWNDNVTNAERPADVLAAWQWRGDLALTAQQLLPHGQRVSGSVGLRAELWPRFEGLDVVVPGVSVGWQWKAGLGLHRPVLAVQGEGEWAVARESGRAGGGAAGRVELRQRVGETWRLEVAHEWRRFDARAKAFDRTGREWSARLEKSIGATWTLAWEGRRRLGDVVSYSRPPRPDLEAIGKPITYVDTFEQPAPWIAYYFRAETRSGAVELSRQWSRSALTLRQEYRHTLHAGPGYRNQLTSLHWTVPF